jgi:hypothetical protein
MTISHDFTTERYQEMLGAAAARFAFISFAADTGGDSVALWRHDIDFSPQRGRALARIEAARGLRATYFVQLSSRYYSVFEPETAAAIREIAALGHDIGLHFDAEVIPPGTPGGYERRLSFEAEVLGRLTGVSVTAFSLHNPTTVVGDLFQHESYAGLLNASHPRLCERFAYCSDSNGLWRHRPLHDMIADHAVSRLYALTHPEWWQDSPMPPRRRIQRCIDGRAQQAARHYDALLEQHGRTNVDEVAGR